MTDLVDVTVPTNDDWEMPAVVATPDDDEAHPGVLVVHDLLGVSDDMRRIAARLAASGYVVLVPDFFGPGHRVPCVMRAVLALKRGHGAPFSRLADAHAYLADRPDVAGHSTAVVGFCIGGGFAVLYTPHSEAQAVAVFYGDVPRDIEKLRGMPGCVAGYGGRDRIFAPHGRRLREHLTALRVERDIVEYPSAGHGYMNDHDHLLARLSGWTPMATGFDTDAAEDSWERMLSFFAEHLR